MRFSWARSAALLALLALPGHYSIAQSGAGLGRSGRWFTYDGQPAYLVGWDCQELACDPTVDYVRALDLFVQYRLNKVRIWLYCYWDPATFLHPWTFSGGRFDLDSWNPAYWQRVRGFLAAAQARNIVVEISVFAPNNIDAPSDWSTWAAWNRDLNANGAFAANGSGHFSPQFYDLNLAQTSTSGRRLRDYQQALVDKAIAELGGYSNVYFEICNEFPVQNASIDSVYPWQLEWARRISGATPRLVTCHAHEYVGDHTRGIQYFWNEPAADVLDFHWTRDPDTISGLLNPAQLKGKILQSNEGGDPYSELSAATRGAWGFFTSGGHYAFYEDDSSRIGSAAWVAGSQRLKALRDIVETLRFWQMSPVDSGGGEYDPLVSQGPGSNWQVIANPGSEYLGFFYGTESTTSARIQLPAGSYTYEWRDARNAATIAGGSVSGGTASIAAPSTSSWNGADGLVLVVRAAAAADRPPSVGFTNPGAGAALSGTVPVNARAYDPDAGTSDGDGIASVVFELRQGSTVVASRQENVVTYDWPLDTTAYPNGTYTLRARATSTSAAGGTSSAADLTVTIANGAGVGTGLTAEYYDNSDLTGLAFVRHDPSVDFAWGTGSPDGRIGADTFSARWSGQVEPLFSETYTFVTTSDDGVRLWVDGRLLIDDWTDHAALDRSATIALSAGRRTDLRLEYYENSGGAEAALSWSSPSQPRETIPTARLFVVDSDGDGLPDAAETALGLDPAVADQDGNGTPDGRDDWDADGADNATELAQGTPPGSPPAPSPGPGGGDGGGCGATGWEILAVLLLSAIGKREGIRAAGRPTG